MIITIDGPTASGKSTVARILATKLGYYYICSGLLFRALAYVLMHAKEYTQETIAHATVEDSTFVLERLVYRYDNQYHERVFFENQDITKFLKESTIDAASSIIATNLEVREFLCAFQRQLATKHNVVVDGRDVGSVVFPTADYKFYLTADPEVRALRWQLQQRKRGFSVSLQEATKIISERDNRDSQRDIAPLIVPEGAIVIDNSSMDAYQTVDEMMKVIRK